LAGHRPLPLLTVLRGDGSCYQHSRRPDYPALNRSHAQCPLSKSSTVLASSGACGEHVMEARLMPHAQYVAVVIPFGRLRAAEAFDAPDRRAPLGRRAAGDQRRGLLTGRLAASWRPRA
jgi:hypothetical protein